MDTTTVLTLILACPLVSAFLITMFFLNNRKAAITLSVGAALGILVLSLYQLFHYTGEPFYSTFEWFTLGNLTVRFGYLLDNAAATMLLVVSSVAFLIHVFSIGYMDHDRSQSRYFAGLSIFMFSMLGIVLSNNLIMLFIFWELVGFSSYALIAHYNDTAYASSASKKAFIVNRVGDFGFLAGIIGTFWKFGTVDLTELAAIIHADASMITTSIALLLMCGFLGKSAQFPLQVWLPDAMAGPTPVSALIHAATMVAAGIYFIIRVYFMFPADALEVILWLGAIMTAYAGLCALVQNDIKKILAYSTLSQLGYMAVALGIGLPGLALFHLATHACFKALLFLGAGSIIHALHHEQNIFKMGGLFRRMPMTSATFTVGLLALCGVTFTSGFFSKDAILEGVLIRSPGLFWLVMGSAFLTALYMGRLFWIVFFGTPNSHGAEKSHESGFVMTFPLLILAVLSLIAGYTVLWPETWSAFFITDLEWVHTAIHNAGLKPFMIIIGTLAWIFGLGFTFFFYKKGATTDRLEFLLTPAFALLQSKLWFDEIYQFYVHRVQQRVANLLSFLDIVFIGGILVRGSAGIVYLGGIVARTLQVGNLQAYVYWFLIGLIVFTVYALDWL